MHVRLQQQLELLLLTVELHIRKQICFQDHTPGPLDSRPADLDLPAPGACTLESLRQGLGRTAPSAPHIQLSGLGAVQKVALWHRS